MKKRDNDCRNLSSSIEEGKSQLVQSLRKINEMGQQMQEQEERTGTELQLRVKAEKQLAELKRELDELADRLDQATAQTSVQAELVRRAEAESARLKRAVDDTRLQSEQMAASVRGKHQEAMADLAGQVDVLNKSRNK